MAASNAIPQDIRMAWQQRLHMTAAEWGASIRHSYFTGKRWCLYALNNHTDLISNLGVLVATTCFLASKVFVNAPAFLPRMAIIILNRGVIIWLNEQVKDLLKSCRDFRIINAGEWQAYAVTAIKVAEKAVGVLLTCGMFGASCATFFGMTALTTSLYSIMRPFSLSALGVGVACKAYDYFVDNALLKQLAALESAGDDRSASRQIAKVMKCFLEVLVLPIEEQQALDRQQEEDQFLAERRLARKIVRQLDMWTVQTFRDSLKDKSKSDTPRIEAIKLFYSVKDSMANSQAAVEANLSLMALGYGAMAISRAWPDTVADMSARWAMSVLYTDELVRQKIFQWDLAKAIQA